MFLRWPVSHGRLRLALTVSLGLTPLVGLILLTGCGGSSSSSPLDTVAITTPEAIAAVIDREVRNGAAIPETAPGEALPGLTAAESDRFTAGRTAFATVEDPDEGLGPVFNGRSCGECHLSGAVGGAAFDKTVSQVTRFGGLVNGVYSDLVEKGGPVIERRSLQEIDPASPVKPEVVPPEARFVSHRTTTPLFGAGLIEAIPEETLRRLADPNDRDRDGISGRLNLVMNPETNRTEVGRFGWKAQVSSLTVFAADAYLNEMGITTPLFQEDLKPQGLTIAGADTVPDPEDDGEDTVAFADFMRLLAPPSPLTHARTERGRQAFEKVGCVSCHVPALATGENAVAALSRKRVALFSDLLLHDMGSGLADGIQQGQATGTEFRTPPLWGTHLRKFYLHDGRASTVRAAIDWHGGEASGVINRFGRLPKNESDALVAFVEAL